MTAAGLYLDLWKRAPLIRFMVRRTRRSAFSATVLKGAWHLLNPLAQMLVYYFLIEVVLGRGSNYGVSAAVLIFVGIVHHQFFASVLVGSCGALRANRGLLLQMPLPPAILVARIVGESSISLCQSMLLAMGLMFFLDVMPTMSLLAYPILLLTLVCMAWSIGLAVAVLGLMFADLRELLSIGLRLLLYVSPVLYPLSLVPKEFEGIYLLNPLAVWFGGLQWSLYGLAGPPIWSMLVAGGLSIGIMVISHVIYLRFARPVTRLL